MKTITISILTFFSFVAFTNAAGIKINGKILSSAEYKTKKVDVVAKVRNSKNSPITFSEMQEWADIAGQEIKSKNCRFYTMVNIVGQINQCIER